MEGGGGGRVILYTGKIKFPFKFEFKVYNTRCVSCPEQYLKTDGFVSYNRFYYKNSCSCKGHFLDSAIGVEVRRT